MTVQEVLEKLKNEKQQQVPARFHCLAIMVDDIRQYKELLMLLKSLPDTKVVPIDILFSGDDVMPDYEKLVSKEYQNEWLILPGVSEYLRLFHTNEESAQRFGSLWHHQFDASTTGRILVPLWGCKSLWYDSTLHLNDDKRQVEDCLDCSGVTETAQQLRIQVLSNIFEQYVDQLALKGRTIFHGLREWYESWYNPKDDLVDQLLLTNRYKSVKSTEGIVSVRVIRDTLTFLQEKFQAAEQLTKDNCPFEAQKCLFTEAIKGKTLDQAILNSLNVLEIKPIDVMSKWKNLTTGQKQIVLLWYWKHPDDTYLSHCVSLSKGIDDLLHYLLMTIFHVHNRRPDWVEDARTLIDSVPIQRTDDYYNALDKIPSFEERLNYLSAKDSKERIYILHLIGQWLRADAEAVHNCERLKEIYPSLLAYLDDDYPDEALNSYFRKYRFYKLTNTLPQDEEQYFNDFDVDDYYFRYTFLADTVDDQTCVLWIDALGAEWAPLLKWALSVACDGNVVTIKIAKAQLPSETCFNEQWKQMTLPYYKYDKLDKLAHKGVIDDKDYYACIEEQLRFVFDITEKVNTLLKEYSRIVVTGDHGTSRLAARFFHKNDGLHASKHVSVGSHGRFCKVSSDYEYVLPTQRIVKEDGEMYYVFANYDHYSKSGFATGADDDNPTYGEIHGGASPEEVLVPVITINSKHEIPLTGKWCMPNNSTKISNKRVKCKIEFSKPVTSVQAKMGEYKADCESGIVPSKEWTLVFNGIKLDKPKVFDVTVIADGMLINMDCITINLALGGGDPF